MASDAAPLTHVTGRCYCGAHLLSGPAPKAVTYCHCSDCKRWTGAPLPGFAGFTADALTVTPAGDWTSHAPGVERMNCGGCGSPLVARFDYLPGAAHVPLGVLEQADRLPPQMHAHAQAALPWLRLDDALPRHHGSAQDDLYAKMPDR